MGVAGCPFFRSSHLSTHSVPVRSRTQLITTPVRFLLKTVSAFRLLSHSRKKRREWSRIRTYNQTMMTAHHINSRQQHTGTSACSFKAAPDSRKARPRNVFIVLINDARSAMMIDDVVICFFTGMYTQKREKETGIYRLHYCIAITRRALSLLAAIVRLCISTRSRIARKERRK